MYPPAALSEFGLLGVLPVTCVLAHLWVSVSWRGSWRFHDASSLYSYERWRGASAGQWPDTLPTEFWSEEMLSFIQKRIKNVGPDEGGGTPGGGDAKPEPPPPTPTPQPTPPTSINREHFACK